MRARFVAVVLLLLPLAAPAAWAADEEVRTIPARRGVTESFLLLRPAGTPVASLIIFAGGDGNLAMTEIGRAHV